MTRGERLLGSVDAAERLRRGASSPLLDEMSDRCRTLSLAGDSHAGCDYCHYLGAFYARQEKERRR